jgi:hypothetical protein
VKKVFASFSAAFAAVPGVTVLVSGLSVPPYSKLLFGGLLEAFGALTLLIVWVNKSNIRKLNLAKLNRLCIAEIVISLICLFGYLAALNFCVVSHPYRGTVYFPLWMSGVAKDMVNTAGSRLASIDRYGYAAVEQAVQQSPVTLALTTAILIVLYQGVVVPLTIAFGVLAIRKQGRS